MADIAAMWGDIAFLLGLAASYAILALALNLEWGYGGMFNAGIVGFWAVGAYVEALVTTNPAAASVYGYPGHPGYASLFPSLPLGPLGGFPSSIIVGMIAAMVASGVLGFLIAIPTLRLREDYLAIATLGLAQVIVLTIQNVPGLTGGVFGISGIARPFQFYQEPNLTDMAFAIFALLALAVAFLLFERMSRSPWGRAMRAVREDEDASTALGKNTFILKLQGFVIGSALMGLSGALFASFSRVLSVPGPFTPALTFLIWVMVMIGGSGNHRGVVLGAFVIAFLFWATPRVPLWLNLTGNISDKVFFAQYIAIGVVLILLVIFRPKGLLPEPARVSRRPRLVRGSEATTKEARLDP
jgi:branched-chain amino acid transport system permease protein